MYRLNRTSFRQYLALGLAVFAVIAMTAEPIFARAAAPVTRLGDTAVVLALQSTILEVDAKGNAGKRCQMRKCPEATPMLPVPVGKSAEERRMTWSVEATRCPCERVVDLRTPPPRSRAIGPGGARRAGT
ncbi:hypothetical protein [Polymorphum gilvum]|uniref:Uncharacterized protein n=1 Tax=Polymorphum gilvum (strain LMG 25793 / CGMCC 1.9160 / SL003B-26A1) TaxID=991905 RepID=F2J507_POLGS|nr:hypothetical protein [Polymorphum gilvum]ADZ70049.1 hypothetical protein SL003B_1621 [Polymorphum gilvum SL003B-26A1]